MTATTRRPIRWTRRAHRIATTLTYTAILALGALYGLILTLWLH